MSPPHHIYVSLKTAVILHSCFVCRQTTKPPASEKFPLTPDSTALRSVLNKPSPSPQTPTRQSNSPRRCAIPPLQPELHCCVAATDFSTTARTHFHSLSAVEHTFIHSLLSKTSDRHTFIHSWLSKTFRQQPNHITAFSTAARTSFTIFIHTNSIYAV